MTTLDSILTGVRERDRQLTVYRSEEESDVPERFATQAVRVEVERLPPGGPEPFVVVEDDGAFVGAIAEQELNWLLEPPIERPGDYDDVSEGYRVLFELLDETVFTALTRRQLLAVSREIEDRAYRVGSGTLVAGFQTLSTFESQLDVYRELATETDLDVHVHGAADWSPPAVPGVTYHGDDAHVRHWALAFDGGPDETQACGLVARETDDGYDGFWTDDAAIVGEILAALEAS